MSDPFSQDFCWNFLIDFDLAKLKMINESRECNFKLQISKWVFFSSIKVFKIPCFFQHITHSIHWSSFKIFKKWICIYIFSNQISYYFSLDTRQIISSISLFSLVIKIFIMTQTTEGCSGTENTQKSTFQFILRALKRLWNFKTDSLNYSARKWKKETLFVCFCTSCLSWQVRYCSCWKDTLFRCV